MKKNLLICFLLINSLIVFKLIVNSQSRSDFEPNIQLTNNGIDFVDLNEFDINILGSQMVSTNTLKLNRTDLLQKFGLPLEQLIMYSEIDETNMDHLVYNGLEVWFINDKLESLSVNSANYCLTFLNGNIFKVGDDVSSIINIYPKSWLNKRDGQVFVGLKDHIGSVDMNLLFEYDTNTNLISGIHFEF